RTAWRLRKAALCRLRPYVQEGVVARRGDVAASFSSRTIQCRSDFFLAFNQLCQWHLERHAFWDPIEIGEDLCDNLSVLSVPALRNISTRHRLEVHRRFLGWRGH